MNGAAGYLDRETAKSEMRARVRGTIRHAPGRRDPDAPAAVRKPEGEVAP
jgi:hypothetical protein